MARDDTAHAPDLRDRLRQRVGKGHAAPAVLGVDDRRRFRGKQASHVRHPLLGEDDDDVAIGVGGAEVVQLDAVKILEQREPVGERLRGQRGGVRTHPGQVRPGVFMRHDLNRGLELRVAAGMIRMRVRIDDRRHRQIGHPVEGVPHRLAPAPAFRVDQHDAAVDLVDQRQRVGTAAREVVERVHHVERVDPDGLRLLLLGARSGGRQRHERKSHEPHVQPPAPFQLRTRLPAGSYMGRIEASAGTRTPATSISKRPGSSGKSGNSDIGT